MCIQARGIKESAFKFSTCRVYTRQFDMQTMGIRTVFIMCEIKCAHFAGSKTLRLQGWKTPSEPENIWGMSNYRVNSEKVIVEMTAYLVSLSFQGLKMAQHRPTHCYHTGPRLFHKLVLVLFVVNFPGMKLNRF